MDQPAHAFAAVGEEVDQLAGHRHAVKLGGQKLAIERREPSLQMLQPSPEGAGNLDGPMQTPGRIHLGDLDMGPPDIQAVAIRSSMPYEHPMFEIIPVIDLREGEVVHAAWASAPLPPNKLDPLPGKHARGGGGWLLGLAAFPTLYVADLDAIEGTGDNGAVLRASAPTLSRLGSGSMPASAIPAIAWNG